jgi:hypothetical protein
MTDIGVLRRELVGAAVLAALVPGVAMGRGSIRLRRS